MLKAGLAARQTAVNLIEGVLRNGEPLDEHFASDLEPRDRAFAYALVAATLRHKGQLEAAIGAFLAKPLPKSAGNTAIILLAGAAQLLVLKTPVHAAIDLQVTLAREDKEARHFTGLINAVLRKVATLGQAPFDNAVAANTPDWLMKRWRKTYGKDAAEAIAAAHLEQPPLDLSVKADADTWAQRLNGSVIPGGGVRLSQPGRIEDIEGFAEGAWWVQDAGAALPARLFGGVRGKAILDLCAAPGGKTAQFAAAGAAVTAVDSSAQRMRRVVENLARLELAAQIRVAGVLDFGAEILFDGVLLDAPCSATGTIRRHPDLPWIKSESQIAELVALQQRLLRHAMTLVKPGGLLVYCVCSLEPEEGLWQMKTALAENESFRRLPVTNDDVARQSQFISPEGDLRTLPSQGVDGFYAARLIRSGS